GAGAQHVLSVAQKLGIRRVLVPADAGLLSAYGLQQASLQQIVTRQVLKTLDEIESELPVLLDELAAEASMKLQQQDIPEGKIEITRKQLFMCFRGQDTPLEVEWSPSQKMDEQFRKLYVEQYGHWFEGREVMVESIRIIASEINMADEENLPFI